MGVGETFTLNSRLASASVCYRLLHDGGPRYRYDKFSAPRPDIAHLFHDFVLDVPRQDHHVIGLGLGDSVRTEYREASPREKHPLFLRCAVNGVLKEVGADTAIIQQCVTL